MTRNTFVGPFTRVYSFVYSEVSWITEFLAFECLLARMSFERMDLQITRSIKLHLTRNTFLGPFTRVYSDVYSEVSWITELFATFLAFEWFLSEMKVIRQFREQNNFFPHTGNTRDGYFHLIEPQKLLHLFAN